MNLTEPFSRSRSPGEHARHGHQDRDVRIVAASVHHADLFAIPLRARLRCERQVDPLLDRQAVHVGTQRDHRAGQRALQQADDAGVRDLCAHFEAELLEMLRDDAGVRNSRLPSSGCWCRSRRHISIVGSMDTTRHRSPRSGCWVGSGLTRWAPGSGRSRHTPNGEPDLERCR